MAGPIHFCLCWGPSPVAATFRNNNAAVSAMCSGWHREGVQPCLWKGRCALQGQRHCAPGSSQAQAPCGHGTGDTCKASLSWLESGRRSRLGTRSRAPLLSVLWAQHHWPCLHTPDRAMWAGPRQHMGPELIGAIPVGRDRLPDVLLHPKRTSGASNLSAKPLFCKVFLQRT